MKKLLLLFVLVITATYIHAQCLPTISGPPGTFSPVTGSFLPNAQSYQNYSQVIEFVVPSQYYDVNLGRTITVDSGYIYTGQSNISSQYGNLDISFVLNSSTNLLPATAGCITLSANPIYSIPAIDTAIVTLNFRYYGKDSTGALFNNRPVDYQFFLEVLPSTPSPQFTTFNQNQQGVFCVGAPVTFSLDYYNGTDAVSWTVPNASPSTGTGGTFYTTFAAGGNVDVKAVVTNALGADSLTQSYTVAALPSPRLNFTTFGGSNCSVYSGNVATTSGTGGSAVLPPPPAPYSVSLTGGTVNIQADNSIPGLTYSWRGPSVQGNTMDNVDVTGNGSYYVIMENQGCSSLSDEVTFTQNVTTYQASLCLVTVDSATGKNLVVWEKNYPGAVDSFYIYKMGNQIGVYDLIHTQSGQDFSTYLDVNSMPEVHSDFYAIGLLDSCGQTSQMSAAFKTIHLTVYEGLYNNINLIWNSGTAGAVSYNIYRGTNPANMSLLTTVNSAITSYTDFSPPAGTVYYQIEGVGITCSPSKTGVLTGKSNIGSEEVEPLLGINPGDLVKVHIFPNPARELINVDLDGVGQRMYQLLIYSVDGRLVGEQPLISGRNVISRNGLPGGIYALEITNGGQLVRRQKVVFY